MNAVSVMEVLVPTYATLLLVLTVYTGSLHAWRRQPDTFFSFLLFGGSAFTLFVQGLAGPEDRFGTLVSTPTILIATMGMVGLVALQSGVRVDFVRWAVAMVVAVGISIGVWFATEDYTLASLPWTLVHILPGAWYTLRSARALPRLGTPARVLWVAASLWLLLLLQHPWGRFHPDPWSAVGAFGGCLLLVTTAGVCAPAITAALAGAEAARQRAEQERLFRQHDAIADYVTRLAFEFRNPLTAIVGYGELLDEALPTGPAPGDLQTIREAAGELVQLVDDVLDLARIEAGQIPLQPRRIEVTAVLDGLGLAWDGPPARATLDPDHAARILTLLVRGVDEPSIQFTPTAGRWTFSTIAHGWVPEPVDALFEPFHRATERTTTTASALGLPLARALARAAGGDVSGVAVPGGVELTLTLPTEATQSEAVERAPT